MKLKIKAFQNDTLDTQECPITGQEFTMDEIGYSVDLDGKTLGFWAIHLTSITGSPKRIFAKQSMPILKLPT